MTQPLTPAEQSRLKDLRASEHFWATYGRFEYPRQDQPMVENKIRELRAQIEALANREEATTPKQEGKE